MMEVPLTETLGLPLIPEVEILGVEATDIPLVDTLGFPEMLLIMLDDEIPDVSGSDVPPTETDVEESDQTMILPDTDVPGVDDTTHDVDEVIGRPGLCVDSVPEVEEPFNAIEIDKESNELDIVDDSI